MQPAQVPAPARRRKPLTPEQRTQAYTLYTDKAHPRSMAYIADILGVSVSVVFRAIHQEAHKRKLAVS